MDISVCPKCKGEGKIRMASRQSGYDHVLVVCNECNGSGGNCNLKFK